MKTKARMIVLTLACTGLGACAHWTPAEQGTAIGGVAGAAIGNALTGGALGVIGGAAAGGLIGHEIGENQEKKKRR